MLSIPALGQISKCQLVQHFVGEFVGTSALHCLVSWYGWCPLWLTSGHAQLPPYIWWVYLTVSHHWASAAPSSPPSQMGIFNMDSSQETVGRDGCVWLPAIMGCLRYSFNFTIMWVGGRHLILYPCMLPNARGHRLSYWEFFHCTAPWWSELGRV